MIADVWNGSAVTSSEFDLVAAELRAGQADLSAYVEALAVKLEGALPSQTVVERERNLLRGSKRVRRIETVVHDRRYILVRRGDGLDTRCAHVVRNVVLKSDDLQLEEWVERLAQDLVAHAEASERGMDALERLLTR
jgi:hypothetical protein